MCDVFLGQIILVPYGFAPREFALCDGRMMAINSNQALFSLLGNKFGGNGMATFALPDLKDKAPEGLQYVIALQGVYPSRD
ncbi:phage tail protein [Saezia sanguinis]|uniref:phage tail protein n=1 Tax=Saezia sanguinis TaxID=1965230 RepID=UPI003041B5E5